MGPRPSTTQQHVDRDGVTHIQKQRTGSGTWIVGLALAFTVLCVIASLWLLQPPPQTDPLPFEAPPPMAASTPEPSLAPSRPRVGAPLPTPAGPATTAASPSPELPQDTGVPAGEAEGLHLYRPGTKPLLQGLVVPEGFPLPDGYMRHYQTTDSGEGLKPILMFRDDFVLKDASGQPVELPSNRVVPMELAPRGMPIEVIDIPAGPEGVEPIP